jgi:hypothetical protein
LASAGGVPPANLSRVVRSFVGQGSRVKGNSYVLAAVGILAGELKVFNLDCHFGTTLDWNRDPKTGTIAPLWFGKTLNYRDESVVGDIKYLWEPNRHLHFVTLAQAYQPERRAEPS